MRSRLPHGRSHRHSSSSRAPVGRDELLALLGSPNVRSRRSVFERYDHLVGSRTVRRPGLDAAVLRLRPSLRGIAVSLDGPGRAAPLDPRTAGARAVFEAARNVACAGGRPLAITDCLNFGNPEKPEIAWELAEAIEGMSLACEVLGMPVVSGNVSLYNETDGRAIPPTPVVGCVGLVADVRSVPGAWREGDVVLLAGGDRIALDGSEYQALFLGRPGRAPAAAGLRRRSGARPVPLALGAAALRRARRLGRRARGRARRAGAPLRASARRSSSSPRRSRGSARAPARPSSPARPTGSRPWRAWSFAAWESSAAGQLLGVPLADLRRAHEGGERLDVRDRRHPRPRPRRRAPLLLRALRAPASRPGVGRHRRLRRGPPHRPQGHGARHAGLLGAEAPRPPGTDGDRALPLLDHGLDALDERAADRAARARSARSRSPTTATSRTRRSCGRSSSHAACGSRRPRTPR